MQDLLKTLTFGAVLALAAPALAQDAATTETGPATEQPAGGAEAAAPAEGGEQPAADPTIDMGEEVTETQVGAPYLKEKSGDWELRCVRAPEGQRDPCQLYQLLTDANGNSVAEFSLVPAPGQSQAAAIATIVTPLETLLTQRMRLAVDGGPTKRYEFTWCSQAGCFARIGLTADDIAAYKRGASVTMSITPVAAPDQTVALKVSLNGFTAGFTALTDTAK